MFWTRSSWKIIRSTLLSITVVLCLSFAVTPHPNAQPMGDDFPHPPLIVN